VPGVMNNIMLIFVRLTPRALLMPMLAYAQAGR